MTLRLTIEHDRQMVEPLQVWNQQPATQLQLLHGDCALKTAPQALQPTAKQAQLHRR
jgi:hypothetical protein